LPTRRRAIFPPAEKLRGLIPDEVARGIALVQPVKAAPYFAHALFSSPATVLAAKAEANAIAALEGGDFTLLNSSHVPAQDVLALARTVIEARVAQRQGDKAAAIERFERAAELQDGLPYMEPPYWYYPVRQSLAVALMQAGRLDEAEERVPACAQARPQQRLVVVRTCRAL
jgi:tetratricopeptide (TPR) repeat protein